MKRLNVEVAVGIFLVIGFLCFAWMAVRLGDIGLFHKGTYPLEARFSSVAGLQPGASVVIAGVKVGTVSKIRLDQESYDAIVQMAIEPGVRVQEDSIASVRSTGLIGEKFISISPGGSPELLQAGGVITETESSISLEELISKYIFEGK